MTRPIYELILLQADQTSYLEFSNRPDPSKFIKNIDPIRAG